MAHKTYGEQFGNILGSNLLWIIHFDAETKLHVFGFGWKTKMIDICMHNLNCTYIEKGKSSELINFQIQTRICICIDWIWEKKIVWVCILIGTHYLYRESNVTVS